MAGPNHEMDWTTGTSFRPGLVDEYVEVSPNSNYTTARNSYQETFAGMSYTARNSRSCP